jgi:hypothetical protein
LKGNFVPLFAAIQRASEGATLQILEDEARAELATKAEAIEEEKEIKRQKAAKAAKKKEKRGKLIN